MADSARPWDVKATDPRSPRGNPSAERFLDLEYHALLRPAGRGEPTIFNPFPAPSPSRPTARAPRGLLEGE